MKRRLHPDDKPRVELVAERMGLTTRGARAMLERCGFAVCESCGRFHEKGKGFSGECREGSGRGLADTKPPTLAANGRA